MTPELTGVLGGGRMGVGIAHAFLLAGGTVRLAEVDAGTAEAARARVARAVEASAERGKLGAPVPDVLARLEATVGPDSLAGCDLVIEAVPEDPALKARVLGALSAALSPDATIATNTSSLSVGELANAIDRPERFLGLHFFNPVPASALVEIVTGERTAPGLADRAGDWVRALGKTPIVVRDSPGFASSRLGVALGLEAIRMVAEGVASPEDIDAAMTLGYKHPVGPLRLTDLVGLDVRLGIAEYLASTLGERFAPPALLREKVARGELGRKSGRGFYSWDDTP
ncbi:3-hydroxyacyl-CoA dehydrogenase [Microtetraspora sp. NBRC 13810]|uniref:3-hydroxyacyl-CoA dehydrogenase family protein n=1 Tax=Microtetraspora sp. NBRC 13810 TaxID=3030990 RepID=UPI0024A39E54|nr:3-hydroxyacyl-CoA dehydrogenase family protein [Microtetraspora sp. NBRC 13810]GLW06486.1 3-hydroxyacyl-CoA dehydrogenase [Microtetraspora sp. NBRC 13810]